MIFKMVIYVLLTITIIYFIEAETILDFPFSTPSYLFGIFLGGLWGITHCSLSR